MPTFTSVFGWALLMAAMTVPYVFAGITVSLALTRSPFPVSLVYGVDLLGAALGCAAVVGILNVLDGPTAISFAGLRRRTGRAGICPRRHAIRASRRSATRSLWRRPICAVIALALLILLNRDHRYGFKPVMVKDRIETGQRTRAPSAGIRIRESSRIGRPRRPPICGRLRRTCRPASAASRRS